MTRVRDVAGSPTAVWSTLADFGSIVDWAPNVDHSCLMSDVAEGVGAARRVQAGRITVVERVVTWQPELVLAYSIEGLAPIVGRVTNTWLVRPIEAEGVATRVTLITDIDSGPALLGKVAAMAASRQLKAASDSMLAGIADNVKDNT